MSNLNRIGYALKQAQDAMHKRMETALRPIALTLAQYAALSALETEDLSNAELARAAFKTPQSMHGVLGTMEKAGLIARRPDAHHGRRQITTLTAQGRSTLTKAHQIIADIEDQLSTATRMPEAELVQILQALRDRMQEAKG